MQVMLSAPSPSEAAKFIGQILSIIASTIFESTTVFVPELEASFPLGEAPVVDAECYLVSESALLGVPWPIVLFLTGETPAAPFLAAAPAAKLPTEVFPPFTEEPNPLVVPFLFASL